jgi:hypothetical protein
MAPHSLLNGREEDIALLLVQLNPWCEWRRRRSNTGYPEYPDCQ